MGWPIRMARPRREAEAGEEMSELTLRLTTDQAAAMVRLLDLATRVHLCQFREIEYLVRMGELTHQSGRKLTSGECADLDDALARVSAIFGFPANANFGIGSQHVSQDAHRGYEIKKVVEKALAEWRDPNPIGIRGVDRDGLIVRYTNDPAPVAVVEQEKKE
jgi:hypothetical protein